MTFEMPEMSLRSFSIYKQSLLGTPSFRTWRSRRGVSCMLTPSGAPGPALLPAGAERGRLPGVPAGPPAQGRVNGLVWNSAL